VIENQCWRFGVFEVDTRNVELCRDGKPVKIREQSFLILVYLLEHAGEIVTREELCRVLWPSDTYVDFDHSLNMAVMKLRESLGESTDTPLYIETIPRRGYRFIAPVSNGSTVINGLANSSFDLASPLINEANGALQAAPSVAETQVPSRRLGRVAAVTGWMLLAAALLAFAVWYLRRPLPPPHIAEYVRLTLDGRHKSPVGTDASRLYLNIGDSPWGPGIVWGAGFVSPSGGEVTRIAFDVPNMSECNCDPAVISVSPDGTRLLVSGSGDFAGSELWNVESSGGSAHLLTKANDATWSPDGKQVVYSSAHGDLFVIPSGGGDSKLIVPSPAGPGETLNTWSLSWSPDGKRLRFVRSDKYWEVSSSGTNLHRLLPGWDDSTPACCGNWTPDGDFFLFLAGDTLKDIGIKGPGAQIWALDERKGSIRPSIAQPVRLTEGPNLWSAPVVSRDGKQIFSLQTTERGELVRYDAGSKQYQPFLGGVSAELAAFSRDGKYVAYVSFPDGVLWRARLDGTERIQLTRPPFRPRGAPSWSPDGTQILFQDQSPSGEYAIYIASSQGGTPVRLVPEDPRPQVDPTWSPDGTKVAYCTDLRFSQKSASITESDTHILDIASHTVTTLPKLKDGFFSPRWSPDGRSVAGMTASQAGLALFDLQTKQYRSLLRLPSPNPQSIGWNTWSHDGHYIYFMNYVSSLPAGSRELMRIPVTGGKPERVVDLSGFQFSGWLGDWFGLDPRDAPILTRDSGTQEIYALTLERKQ
jgi:Tol biopolymer transport system component/DNA-binding winged helix-turn-helix (wHTH) protein